jgi:hypothetical protein
MWDEEPINPQPTTDAETRRYPKRDRKPNAKYLSHIFMRRDEALPAE